MTRTTEAAGFTLIEVVAALVVTSLLLTFVMRASIDARARQTRAEQQKLAVLLAQSLLARQALAGPEGAAAQGGAETIRWSLEESRVAEDPRGFFVLNRISVRITDRSGRLLFVAATRKLKSVRPT